MERGFIPEDEDCVVGDEAVEWLGLVGVKGVDGFQEGLEEEEAGTCSGGNRGCSARVNGGCG